MKVFVSGSRDVKGLPGVFKCYLSKYKGQHFLVGDCYGVDELVQTYIYEKLNSELSVYYSGKFARVCLGDAIKVSSEYNYGRKMHEQKDIQMSRDCDYAIALSNGSAGTEANIKRVRNLGKPYKLFRLPKIYGTWVESSGSLPVVDIRRSDKSYSSLASFLIGKYKEVLLLCNSEAHWKNTLLALSVYGFKQGDTQLKLF